MDILAKQCRAARGLLDWTQDKLAERAGVSKRTIVNFERGASMPTRQSMRAIRGAFEAAGIAFINDDEPGVKLRAGTQRARGDGQGQGPDVLPPAPPKSEAHAIVGGR
jgi:transcriptional regulator with XRE-family HTH domain